MPLNTSAVKKYSFGSTSLSLAVIAKLERSFPTLQSSYSAEDNTLICGVEALTDEERVELDTDISFYQKNRDIPLENICSTLRNYRPQNQSQQQMLDFATKLLNFNDFSQGAGLFMIGTAGIGKTHISVGIAKEFMKMNLEPRFFSADRFTFSTKLDLRPSQVWIIDDMNNGFGVASMLLKKVILHTHEYGGRIFVTSNKKYSDLMREMFVTDGQANRARYEDRTKGMLKILEVEGDSYRQENAWYNK